ncbi:MAG TPA: SPFH domain-containing protein [Rhodanobacteraceae bacterium]
MTPALAILVFLLLAAALVALSVKRIPEGQVYTLRRLGRPAGTLTAGTHLIVPLVEHVAHKISIAGYTLAVDEALADAPATLHGRVWWQVLDPERADAVIERADDLIRGRLRDAVEVAKTDPAADRRARNQHIKQTLNGSLRERGVLVTRVELDVAA